MKFKFAVFFLIYFSCFSPAQNIHIQEIQGGNLKDNLFKLIKNDSIIDLSKLDYRNKHKETYKVILISVTPIESQKHLLKISYHSYDYFKNNNLLGDYYCKYLKKDDRYYIFISENKLPLYKELGKENYIKGKQFYYGTYKKRIKKQGPAPDEDMGEVQILTISDKKIKSYATVGSQFYYPEKNDLNYYEELLDMKID